MDEPTRDVVTDALIREAVGLAVILGVLWVMGPGKVWLAAAAHRVQTWRRADRFEGTVRQFAREVSEWDHEQVAKQDRPPAAGGCGCG